MSVCGDFGGVTAKGEPCQRASSGSPCPAHKDQAGPASPFDVIQHPKKRAYLRAVVECGGNVSRACEVVGIDRSTPYTAQWQDDDEFQELLRMAEGMAADHLEAEAIRRAYEGVTEPVGFYRGSPSAYVQKYSDTLLIFLLKGARPDKYADRHRLEHSGRVDTGVLAVSSGDVDPELWATLAKRQQASVSPNGGNGNGKH